MLTDGQFYDIIRMVLKDPDKFFIIHIADVYYIEMGHYDGRIPLAKAFLDFKNAKINSDTSYLKLMDAKLKKYMWQGSYYTEDMLKYLLEDSKKKRRKNIKNLNI